MPHGILLDTGKLITQCILLDTGKLIPQCICLTQGQILMFQVIFC